MRKYYKWLMLGVMAVAMCLMFASCLTPYNKSDIGKSAAQLASEGPKSNVNKSAAQVASEPSE